MIKKENINKGVYGIFTQKNQCLYIGCSKNINNRFSQHTSSLILKRHPNTELQKFCDYFGYENLVFKTLMFCDEDEILFYENIFIKLFNPVANVSNINKSEIKTERILSGDDYECIVNYLKGIEHGDYLRTKDISDAIFKEIGKQISLKKIGSILNIKGYKPLNHGKLGRVFVKR